jgi:hypothetical protein
MKTYLIPFALFFLIVGCARDREAPTVAINEPIDGAMVRDTVAIRVSAEDNIEASRVELYIDGVIAAQLTAAPYDFSWITNSLADSSAHVLLAKAYDAAENEGVSDTVRVTVYNGAIDVLIWEYDPLDKYYDQELDDSATAAERLQSAISSNGVLSMVVSQLPFDLSEYRAVFVTTGFERTC